MVSLRDAIPEESGLSTRLEGTSFQHLSVDTVSEGRYYAPLDIKIETNRYSAAGRAEVEVYLDGESYPEHGDLFFININGERVFTGKIQNPSNNGDGTWTITAFDGIKELKQKSTSRTFESAELEEIIRIVAGYAGYTPIVNIPNNITVSPDFDNTPVLSVIDQVSKWGNVLWWIDENNDLHVENPDPTIHRIDSQFIEKNPDAGESEQPYRRVIVQGESPASESKSAESSGGFGASHMLSKNPVSAIAGAGEPTYYYQSKQIRTEEQAEIAAQAILEEFQMQRAQGMVGIVGEGAPIRPFDVISMPRVLNYERYMAASITHRFNNNDGFITDVNCGGLIDGYVDGYPVEDWDESGNIDLTEQDSVRL